MPESRWPSRVQLAMTQRNLESMDQHFESKFVKENFMVQLWLVFFSYFTIYK